MQKGWLTNTGIKQCVHICKVLDTCTLVRHRMQEKISILAMRGLFSVQHLVLSDSTDYDKVVAMFCGVLHLSWVRCFHRSVK